MYAWSVFDGINVVHTQTGNSLLFVSVAVVVASPLVVDSLNT